MKHGSTSNGVNKTDTQFSVFLANKPNILAQVCQRLADDHVNIVALSMMDASEHGVLRIVVENPQRARDTLTALNVPTTETTVLVATLPNRPGAMADVVERLASNHITVSYAYCTTGAAGGKTLGIFRVSDFKKAMQVLEERKPRRKAPLLARTGAHPQRRA
jgi:hypothetical protein